MKKINLSFFILSTLLFSSLTQAQSATKIYKGISNGSMKVVEVEESEWLDKAQETLESNYDFNENVSYVFEDIDDVQIACDLTDEETERVFEGTEMDILLKWSKIIKAKNKKTVAYVLKLYADLNWTDEKTDEYKSCEVHRGTYVINKKGKEIDDSKLYKSKGVSFGTFL
ncbi:hypothetical protein N9N67_03935 [Bacteriovoracaceae bacterium]|nr:hypothetical protein [Bacteriovoracaceae bacterium]